MANAGAFVSRLLPGFLPPIFAHVGTYSLSATLGGVLILAWIGIHNLPGFITSCFFCGVLLGIIITLTTVMVPVLSPVNAVHETIGTRLGMTYLGCGIGVLIGSPVAGALADLGTGSFVGGQAWAGGGAAWWGGVVGICLADVGEK